MPTPTYKPLATVTLAGSTSSVTFSSIPATFRDLVLVFNGGAVSGAHNLTVAFNSDTTSGNYSGVSMTGTGSSALSTSSGLARLLNDYGYLEANQAVIVSQFMDYSATDKHKTFLSRSNNAANGVSAVAGRWANTAAITSIAITTGANFSSGSTLSLYGIAS
jgi:hypothetical protein